MRAPFFQLDAFTGERFRGNPAGVVVLERFPADAVLQAIAAENNLPETAFLARDGSGYRLRWFTPTTEVPLCGHATLAAAAVVTERLAPDQRVVAFSTRSGPLLVERRDAAYMMDFPARRSVPAAAPPALAGALRAEPREVWADEHNYLVVLESAEQVRELRPDLAALATLDRLGVIVTAAGDAPHDITSRYFAPRKGIPEDPVTGGAHCALTPFWAPRLGTATLRALQASPRGGELTCHDRGDRVGLAGRCVWYLEGEIRW